MYNGQVEPSYITCATGVIIEFISSIFFYLYNRTVASMGNYHDKLVLSQNISIALKAVDSIENSEMKDDLKAMTVRELLKEINSYLLSENSERNQRNTKIKGKHYK